MVSQQHVGSLRERLQSEGERLDSEMASLEHEKDHPSTAQRDEGAIARSTGTLEDRLGDARQRSEEVRGALQRLDDGTFGRCVDCGGDIDDERLLLDPTTTRCRLHAED